MAKESNIDEELLAKLSRIQLFEDLAEETRKNKKQRQALSDFHRFKLCERDSVVIEQGEYTGEFCVLLDGTVSAFRFEEGVTRRLGTLRPGQWFGEMSAMSNQPAVATVQSEERSMLLVVDRPLFKELYEGNKGDNAFKKYVDAQYSERALAVHLRVAPLLTGLGEAELEEIRKGAELVMFEEGEVIARQGDEADAVYLLRSGAVKCVRKEESGQERILSYFKDNSSFGERALAREDREWPGTLTTMTSTDAVKLPRELFEQAFLSEGESDTQTMTRLQAAADQIVAEESGRGDELEIMVQKETVKGGRALVIDLAKCTRCNACVESCVAVHEDGVPRLSKKGNRISSDIVLSSACYSCAIPDCMQACDYGAIRRDVNGSIRFIFDNCTGCTFCVPACPYDVIRMTPPPGVDTRPPGFVESIPFLGRLFSRSPRIEPLTPGEKVIAARTGKQVAGKAIKCDLCAGLPYEACVYNCPCGAIERIDPSALFAEEESSDLMSSDGAKIRFLIPGKRKGEPPKFESAAESIEIGSGSACTLHVDDPVVSDTHCRLHYRDGGFQVEDLGSATGTYLDGTPVTQLTALADGSEIVFGVSRMTVTVAEEEGEATLQMALNEKSFHFVEKGKGEKLADLYQWVRSEVTFGRSKSLSVTSLAAGGAAALFLVLALTTFVREPLADPGALHDTHRQLFESKTEFAHKNLESMFPEELAIANAEGCAACHTPFGGTPIGKCVQCHESLAVNHHPFQREALSDGHAPWGENACVQCHLDHPRNGDRLVPDLIETPNTCEECHPSVLPEFSEPVSVPLDRVVEIAYDAFPHSVHLTGDNPIDCGACHLKARFKPLAVVSRADKDFGQVDFETCAKCHSKDASDHDSSLVAQWLPQPEHLFSVNWHGTDGDGEKCLQCHASVSSAEIALTSTEQPFEPRFLIPAAYDHEQFFGPHPDFSPDADFRACDECHQGDQLARSAAAPERFWHGLHMTQLDPGADDALALQLSTGSGGCAECHAGIPTSERLGGDPLRGTEGRCAECHLSGEPTLQAGESRARQRMSAFPHGVHVAAFGQSESLKRGCYACHGFDEATNRFEALPTTIATASESCMDCHAAHADVGGGDCGACHAADDAVWSARAITKQWPELNTFDHFSPGHVGLSQDQQCVECHADITSATTISEISIPTEADVSCRQCHVAERKRFHWR